MSILKAIILGIIQGLTEFLPVSSSGHIEIGKALLGVQIEDNISFTVVLHGATVLSTIVIFYKEIFSIIKGVFEFKWNYYSKYFSFLLVSTIPVAIIGFFFKDNVESLFTGNLILVGAMLIITGILLSITYFYPCTDKNINFFRAFIIGIAQAIAVIPGISRSGATISTALMLKVKKDEATTFSFLMVLLPIIGANILDFTKSNFIYSNFNIIAYLSGFLAAFISGLFACKWMISLVKKRKLIYFAIYCFLVGIISIILDI